MAAAPARRHMLLIELGTEELPPRNLQSLSQAFADAVKAGLVDAGVADENARLQVFATPRRLALKLSAVAGKQPERIQQRRGPAMAIAYDQAGRPSKALLGFARSCGVSPEQLTTLETAEGCWVASQQRVAGKPLAELVEACLQTAVKRLPIARRMRWGDHAAEFVRPVHWLVVLHRRDCLPVSVLGLHAGRDTCGHRFHAPVHIKLSSVKAYPQWLERDGWVVADFAQRQSQIRAQAEQLAAEVGAQVALDQRLLDLVTGLVEWPQALLGEFDRRFLAMPEEVLIACLRDHQKYFYLTDDKQRLLPMFITVSNIDSSAPAQVRRGNERVLRARLSDAEFFWNADRTAGLDAAAGRLDGLLFHHKLGTVQDKALRLRALAGQIAASLDVPVAQVERAAVLCKADLVTEMVAELPELQGIVGRYYALEQHEPKAVAAAIEQHYLPRFAGDRLPENRLGCCLALADRIDSLAGIFASGEVPTGDKDPYALRRAALGVVRILIERRLELDLYALLATALAQFEADRYRQSGLDTGVLETVFDYITERLKGYYQRDFSAREISAVLACRPRSLLDFDHRLRALNAFCRDRSADAAALAAANKRIAHILQQAGRVDTAYQPELAQAQAEKALAGAVSECQQQIEHDLDRREYAAVLQALAALQRPIDRFFDQVMVMDKDPAVKANRLALLSGVLRLFLTVADISTIQVE